MIWLLPHPLSSHEAQPATCRKTEKERQFADGERGGRGWGRSKITRRRESLAVYKSYSKYVYGVTNGMRCRQFIDFMIDTTHYAIARCLRSAPTYSTETFCSQFDRPDLRYEPGFHKYSSIEALQKYAGRQIEDSEVFD
jgi:hypothetical protein